MNGIRCLLAGGAVLAAFAGLPLMLRGESHIALKAEDVHNLEKITAMVDDGLKPYFWGIGLVFALVGLAIVLADGEEKTSTPGGATPEKG